MGLFLLVVTASGVAYKYRGINFKIFLKGKRDMADKRNEKLQGFLNWLVCPLIGSTILALLLCSCSREEEFHPTSDELAEISNQLCEVVNKRFTGEPGALESYSILASEQADELYSLYTRVFSRVGTVINLGDLAADTLLSMYEQEVEYSEVGLETDPETGELADMQAPTLGSFQEWVSSEQTKATFSQLDERISGAMSTYEERNNLTIPFDLLEFDLAGDAELDLFGTKAFYSLGYDFQNLIYRGNNTFNFKVYEYTYCSDKSFMVRLQTKDYYPSLDGSNSKWNGYLNVVLKGYIDIEDDTDGSGKEYRKYVVRLNDKSMHWLKTGDWSISVSDI